MYLVILLYALFASTFTIAKNALAYSPPLYFVGIRMLMGGLGLLIYVLIKHPKDLWVPRGIWIHLILLGLFNIFLTNALEFWGLQYLSAGKTCFLYSLSPFMSALFSYLYLQEKMSLKKGLGMIIGFIGFLPVLMRESGGEVELGHFFIFSWAELAVLGAATSTVWGWILMRKLVTDFQCSTVVANAYSMLIGSVMSLISSFYIESWNPTPVINWSAFLFWTITLTIISNAICYNLYGHLLKKFTATFMSFAGFITPLFASFIAWVFLGEAMTWHFYFAILIVTLGLTIFHQEELKKGIANNSKD